MPKISIIVPCFNAQAYIGQTLESVRRQSLTDWELVVVDDGSTDGSAEVVAALLREQPGDRRLRLVQQPNGGVASARNLGFRRSDPSSDYLLFLDADDCLEPAMLETMVSYLDRHPAVGMAYCGHAFIDDQDRPLPAHQIPWTPRYVPRGWGVGRLPARQVQTPFVSIFTLAGLLPSLAVMRRSVYQATPGWDEAMGHVYEDTDLFLQLALRSQVHYVARPLVHYRRHDQQSTADPARVAAQEAKLYAKWRQISGLTPAQRAMVRRAQRFREGRLIPMVGGKRGLQLLREGHLMEGLIFLGGAARRYCGSLWN